MAGRGAVGRNPRLPSGFMNHRPTVLLVDADPSFSSVARISLAGHGYVVEHRADASAALEAALHLNPDLVVIDMILSGRSGFRLLEELKMANRARPVIMAASFGSMAQRGLAELLGADDFLIKPVSMNRLLESVRRFCTNGLTGPHRSMIGRRTHDIANGT
jgi:DNA-binding response OmpR family regulator